MASWKTADLPQVAKESDAKMASGLIWKRAELKLIPLKYCQMTERNIDRVAS